MTTLTPTARILLGLLADGPATDEQLHERSGRSRATVDRTLADLATRGLITRDPASDDDDTDRWALTPGGRDSIDEPTTDDGDAAHEPGDQPEHSDDTAADEAGGADDARNLEAEPAAEAKACRGCRAPIPPICPTCWQKTTVYFGTCRRTMPTTERGTTREPQILSNGLPKLRPGELERMIQDVLATHPVPDYGGIVGWTSGRIAVHLPGRSVGAINRVLDKLASGGVLTQLGSDPKRYRTRTAPVALVPEEDASDPSTDDEAATDTSVPGETADDESAGQGPDGTSSHGPASDHTQ